MNGTVITMASILKKAMISSGELEAEMKTAGTLRLIAIETRLVSIPTEMTRGTWFEPNQLSAILLGVFRMKTPPIPERSDPRRQMKGSPTCRKVRSQTPVMTSPAETKKLTRMPFLLRSQLQGKEKSVCAMVKRRLFNDTSMMLSWKVFQTMELIDEKALEGIEFTSAARMQDAMTTYRYLYYFIGSSIILILINQINKHDLN